MLWEETWNRETEAVPWFSLMKTERDGTSTATMPEYSWFFSPPDEITSFLGLSPATVLFRDDYLRVFRELFASSGFGDFTLNLDHNPGATFPNIFSGVRSSQKPLANGFILTGHPGIGT